MVHVLGMKVLFGRFIEEWNKANITFLELFPIVIALEFWGHLWKNQLIIFYTENEALSFIINKLALPHDAMGLSAVCYCGIS